MGSCRWDEGPSVFPALSVNDVVTRQRFAFEQLRRHDFEQRPVFCEHRNCACVRIEQHALHFGINELRGLFRYFAT